MKNLKGHKTAIEFLSKNLSLKRIANGYLFVGPDGVGKALTAKAFVLELLCSKGALSSSEGGLFDGFEASSVDDSNVACGVCSSCKKIEQGNHPDLLWIKPEKNKKVKIEQIRQAKVQLTYKPYESAYNICVIEDAHLMTQEASNALLKILEEPPGHSLIILVTSKREWLLPTVISRCLDVKFHPLSIDITKQIILENVDEINEEDALMLASISAGSPGRALKYELEVVLERRARVFEVLKKFVISRNPYCFSWDSDKKDEILEDIEMLIMFFRDLVIAREVGEGLFYKKC